MLDKVEVRHVAVMAMGLTNQEGAYRFKPKELVDWVLERQDAFAQADLSLCTERHMRPGVLQYLRDLQGSLRGSGVKVEWPPTNVEIPQDQEELPMSHDDQTFQDLLDDEEDEAQEAEEPAEDPPEEAPEAVTPEPPIPEAVVPEVPQPEPAKPAEEPMPQPEPPKPTTPAPLGRPAFRRVGSAPPAKPAAPTPPAPQELPGTITETLSNVSNRVNAMTDQLEVLNNRLESGFPAQLAELRRIAAVQARVQAIETTVARVEAQMQLLSTAMLHLINTIQPWAESGVLTFPSLDQLPDSSVYGDSIVRDEEGGQHG